MTQHSAKITPLMDPLPRSMPAENPCAACAVRDLSVCGALAPEHIDRLNEIVAHKTVTAGETLFIEGDAADALFIVTEGCIKLYKMLADGRRQITGFLFRSDIVGLAFRQRYAFSAEAVSTSTLCRFPKHRLETLLDEFPEMERRLLSISSNELASAQDQMLLLGRKSAAEKVASFLWVLSQRALMKEADPKEILLPMMRSDIADYLGLTIETVSRTFTRFRKDGLISFDNAHSVRLEEMATLAEIAGVEDDWDMASALPARTSA